MRIQVSTLVGTLLVLCAAGLVSAVSPVYAQSSCPLSMTVTYVPVQQLSLTDVDFEHFRSNALLFTAAIVNSQATVDSTRLHITLRIQLADGTTIDPGVDYTSKPFPVPPGGRTITNLNLGGNGNEIATESFTFSQDARNRVEDVALATGRFPAGVYTFNFILLPLGCSPVSGGQVVLTLVNPSRIELRSPADGETTNQFPLFEFYSDASHVVLTVAEKDPAESREDAIQRKPSMLQVELNGQNTFLYSGGRPLEDGKTYVWQVVGKTLGSGGSQVDLASPIGLFKVSGTAGGNFEDALLDQLEQILGSRYAEVFKTIRSGGFRLTGQYSLDGNSLTREELLDLVNQLRQLADGIDVTLE